MKLKALALPKDHSPEAREVYDEIISLIPDFPDRASEIVGLFLHDHKLQKTILHGLSLAGLMLSVEIEF